MRHRSCDKSESPRTWRGGIQNSEYGGSGHTLLGVRANDGRISLVPLPYLQKPLPYLQKPCDLKLEIQIIQISTLPVVRLFPQIGRRKESPRLAYEQAKYKD